MLCKRLISIVLTIALVLSIGIVPVSAAEKTVVMMIDSGYCSRDGEIGQIDPNNIYIMPCLINSRTMLPIRMLVEYFGGTAGWDEQTRQVTCTLGDNSVIMTLDSATALVNGVETILDVAPVEVGGRTLVPVRFVSESLNLNVGWNDKYRVVVVTTGELPEGVSIPKMPQVSAYLDFFGRPDPITYTNRSYALASGTVKAKVITVDMSDPRIRVEARHVASTLNHTASFADIVAGSTADVILNANFFDAYQDVKDPIGTLMSNGEFLYCNSGTPSLAFAKNGRTMWGNPPVFVRFKTPEGIEWAAYTVNVLGQGYDTSIMYTPARGASFPAKIDGYAMTVINGVITDYSVVAAGSSVAIPANGCVLFMGPGFTQTEWYRVPVVGTAVTIEPYLRVADAEGMTLEGVEHIISGAPRLVKDGAISTEMTNGFTEARFTTAVTSRTAIGTTYDGKLVIVSTASASIQCMRELMLALGCYDATNLDGGSSTALYYRGQVLASPGRQLTSTLHIFCE